MYVFLRCCDVPHALTAILVFSSTVAGSDEFELKLSVPEPTGISRRSEPISGGVPLPKGVFAKNQPFALFRLGGTEVACQIRPLVVQPDGTLRWVLVDFQDDLDAGATGQYVLRSLKPSAEPPKTLRVEQNDRGLTVDTGKIRFRIAKGEPFALFREVQAHGRPVITGGRVSYVQMHGRTGWNDLTAWQTKEFTAAPPTAIRLHYAGPLRVTIEATGQFADDPLGVGYTAWITAWAGQSRVAAKYQLRNSNPEQYTAVLVGRSTIELDLAAAGDVTLGGREPIEAGRDGWLHQGLLLHDHYQDIPGAVKAGSGNQTLWTGDGPADRPAGWIASRQAGFFVLDRLFATNPARRLAISGTRVTLEGVAQRFQGPKDQKFKQDRRVGQPWQADGCWLFDCSHHTSEYVFDFAPPTEPAALEDFAGCAGTPRVAGAESSKPQRGGTRVGDSAGASKTQPQLPRPPIITNSYGFELARTHHGRLWAFAEPAWYAETDALGTGRFGTLQDEIAAYRAWGWSFREEQVPRAPQVAPGAFVAWEDNHYESEADSVQGLLRMAVRTGQRGWFDLAEAWARYHTDLQTWRTDGWRWKDGAIWFPQGGPQGNRPTRTKWNFDWGPDWGERQNNLDCRDLWRHAQAKSCYCHFYGSGLADWFCLTGEPDALAAAIDNVEQKDEEFRRHHRFQPGETPVGCIRGFGRGFEVMMRVLQADPGNTFIQDLCHLSARTLWASPLLDERGFHCSHVGGGWSGMKTKEITPNIKQWMSEHGITLTAEGDSVATLSKGDRTWPVHCYGGTWQHPYIQNGAAQYAAWFDDEDMRDFAVAFAEMSARYMLSPKCHQTWYYTYFDVPDLGMVFDPWAFEHTDTTDGEGCIHSGYYTRFFPDACAIGYALTGEQRLLDRGREFWYYGSKREYQTKRSTGGPNEVGQFATHYPPKDDTVLEVGRLFYEATHPRGDREPPAAISDLQVVRLDADRAEVRCAAPADRGDGRVVRYQVKAAELPLVPYEQYDYARDFGQRRNWWRAANCQGEPAPASPGARERFVVTGLPRSDRLYFAIRSFDEHNNRSPISNVVAVERAK